MIAPPRNINASPEKNISGNNLIFLVSQPRSGSSLLQVLLSGNPEIATSSEPWIALHPVFAMREKGLQAVYDSGIARNALVDFLNASGADKKFLYEQIGRFLTTFYLKAIEQQGKTYFLDKTPRYYHIIDELAEIFPTAKFIILYRNPLSVLHSIFRTWVKDDYSSVVNFFEDLWIAPFKLVNFVNEHPDKSFPVKYEDLVSSPDNVLKGICRFIGIEFIEDMLQYGERLNPSWKFGDKAGLHKSTNPVVTSINKWKQGFDTPESASFATSYLESLGPDIIAKLGYDYNDIKDTIQLPADLQPDKTLSFSEVMDIIEGVSSIKDIRKAAFVALSEEKKFKKHINIKHLKWNDWIDTLVVNTLNAKLSQVNKEINHYKNELYELGVENNTLQSKIDRMQNTLSWQVTAPLRNSKILNRMSKLLIRKQVDRENK